MMIILDYLFFFPLSTASDSRWNNSQWGHANYNRLIVLTLPPLGPCSPAPRSSSGDADCLSNRGASRPPRESHQLLHSEGQFIFCQVVLNGGGWFNLIHAHVTGQSKSCVCVWVCVCVLVGVCVTLFISFDDDFICCRELQPALPFSVHREWSSAWKPCESYPVNVWPGSRCPFSVHTHTLAPSTCVHLCTSFRLRWDIKGRQS